MVAAAISWGAGLTLSAMHAGKSVNMLAAVCVTGLYAIGIIHIVRKKAGSSIRYMLLPVLFLFGILHAEKAGHELYDAKTCLSEVLGASLSEVSEITGRVIKKERKETEEGETYVLTIGNVVIDGRALSGLALVYSMQDVKIGSRVRLSGEVGTFDPALNPGGFDAFSHYGYRGIYYRITNAEIRNERKSNTPADAAKESILRLRLWLSDTMRNAAPADVHGFFQGVLLGEKDRMDEEAQLSMRRSGLAHILTVSGLHISMLGVALMAFLKWLRIPFYPRLLLGGILIGMYVYMTGSGYPALRAYDMFLIASGARLAGRTYDGKCALSVCFLWRTWHRPLLILDAGFLLSYLSMIAILWAVPYVQAFWIRSKAEGKMLRSRIRAALLTSWTVLVVISPVISYAYFETARYAMFLNLLALPMLTFLLLTLLIGLILMILPACFGLPACRIFLLPSVVTARMILSLARWFEHLLGNVCITGRPGSAELFLYFVIYGGGLLFLCLSSGLEGLRRQERRTTGRRSLHDRGWFRNALFMIVLIFGLMIPDALHRKPPSVPELTMLDVGQGDGFVFRFPNGETLLIDGGNTYREDLWSRAVEPALLYYGIDTIDAWLLTHFDMDHISAFVQREQETAQSVQGGQTDNRRIRCKRLLISREDTAEQLIQLCGHTPGCEILSLNSGVKFAIGGAEAICLLPDSGFPVVTENDASVVFRMEANGHVLLFCADMSQEQEMFLIRQGTELSAEVLKVAHHGSAHSTCDAFAEAVRPKTALISVGKNSYGHPSPEVLTRLALCGADIRMTNRKGAVILLLKDEIEVFPFLP